MTSAGWMIMTASVCGVLGLVSFCMYRVLSLPAAEAVDMKAPLDIDTGDTQDAD